MKKIILILIVISSCTKEATNIPYYILKEKNIINQKYQFILSYNTNLYKASVLPQVYNIYNIGDTIKIKDIKFGRME